MQPTALAPDAPPPHPAQQGPPPAQDPHFLAVKLLRLARPPVDPLALHAALPAAPPAPGADSLLALYPPRRDADAPASDPLWDPVAALPPAPLADAPQPASPTSPSPPRAASAAAHLARNAAPLPHALALPTSFGNIYLGEPLRFALHVNHDGAGPVPGAPPVAANPVSVKIELQTSTTRSVLLDTAAAPTAPAIAIPPCAAHRWTVHHDVRELGMHILVVQVLYSPTAPAAASATPAQHQLQQPQQQQRYLRKFYKFQVLNPFQVRTKTTALPHARVLLELALQNLATTPVHLARVALVPNTADYHVVDVAAAGPANLFPSAHLQPGDLRQYLYQFTPRSSSASSSTTLAAATAPPQPAALGRLELEWEGALEAGRLQTPPLPRKTVDADLEVADIASPRAAPLGVPFAVTLLVTNTTRVPATLHAQFTPLTAPGNAAPPVPPVPGSASDAASTKSPVAGRPDSPLASPPGQLLHHQQPPLPPSHASVASLAGSRSGTPSLLSNAGTGRASPTASMTGGRLSPASTAGFARRPTHLLTPGSNFAAFRAVTAPAQHAIGTGGPDPPSALASSPPPPPPIVSPIDRNPYLVVLGPSTYPLADVPAAGGNAHLVLQVVGLRRGVLALPPVRLVDARSGVVREVDPRVRVLVG
ncbi:hypothetical protein H9P43_008934 [Blastocladiella emersonii ATCC 22665]|nr:hypothetical protein H9P43_008934 [Blastocladiella emersonii ATCC 22665]